MSRRPLFRSRGWQRVAIRRRQLPETPGVTVNSLIAAYLADQQTQLNPHTFKNRELVCRRFAEAFGERLAEDLHPSEVRSWIFSRPEWLGATTRWSMLLVIKRLYNWARKDRRITASPLEGLVLRKGKPRRATTEAEFQLMLRLSDPAFRRVLIFMRATGCRPEDVRQLEWSWIDWQQHKAVIPPEHHKTGAKTGECRTLLLIKSAMKLLAWLRNRGACEAPGSSGQFYEPPDNRGLHNRADGGAPERHVFRNSRGASWTRSAFGQRLLAMRRHGLPAEACLHGIRHLWGSSGVSRGASLKLVSVGMGHAKVETTEQTYLHLQDDMAPLLAVAEIAAARPKRIGR